jgi:hypothetical protein
MEQTVMTLSDEMVRKKFDLLLQRGQGILRRCGYDGQQYQTWPPDHDYQQFRAEVENLVNKVCGIDSAHACSLKQVADKNQNFANIYGILKAAHQDYEDGFLVELRRLVRADLLDDFLSQAEMLLNQGYHIAAASLSGAVLEDTLRKLCDVNSITYPDKTKIDTLNVELAKKDIYDKLIQKEITAKADLRNNADHGKFAEVREADVKDMVRWVRRFVTERLR